jgi:hypothetical protein
VSYSPQLGCYRRGPRFRLTDITPAILQFQNGRRTAGELLVISHNGGLLLLPEPVPQGSVVELMLQTHKGPVLGTAEMLMPIASTQQPFRFLTLPESDEHTLQAASNSRLYRNTDEEERIEELRAAIRNWTPSPWRRHWVATLVTGLIALAACLICAHYIQRFPH